MSKKQAVTCPNCGEPAERMSKGVQVYILCEKEDKVFALTATGAKVAARGRLDEFEDRIKRLEASIGKPAEPVETDGDDEDADEDDEDDDGPSLEIVFGSDDDDEEKD